MTKGATGPKKYIVLFAILFLPTIAYMVFIRGEHNFAHLPFLTYVDADGVTQNRAAPSFSLTDQDGNILTDADMKGKIFLVDFFFTSCPSICPIMTANLMNLQDRFAHYDEFEIVSHTVDPKRDTPSVLKDYAENRKINLNKWHFLTGDRDTLYDVAYDYLCSAMEDSMAPGGFLHTEYFVLVDKEGFLRSREDDNGNIIGVYDGTDAHQMRDLIDDIKVLIAEYNLALKKNDKKEM